MSTQQNSDLGKVFRLRSEPNNYPWGEVGNDSLAAIMAENAVGADFELDPKREYAELWMGTHPNNPSKIFSSPSTLLSDYLSSHPELLGDAAKFPARYPGVKGTNAEGGHVPFLFKILTCKQALPLQIHPDVELAKKLHKEDPEQFPDTNHKPEIAVCLSDRFLGFAGIRPIDQVRSLLASIPEIQQLSIEAQDAVKALVSQTGTSTSEQEHVRAVFKAFISMEGKEVEKAVSTFTERISKDGKDAFAKVEAISEDDKGRLAEAVGILAKYNPGDGSIFTSICLMNLVELKKGEGMYVGADGPHAWLTGEIVELMAASDNVLNVGFTPSDSKNSTRLVAQAITAKPTPSSEILLKHQSYSKGAKGNTTVYSTPFEEFSILRIGGPETLKPITGPGIAIVTESKSTTISHTGNEESICAPKGSVWFIGAGTEIKVRGEGEIWMAFYDGDSKSQGQVGKQ